MNLTPATKSLTEQLSAEEIKRLQSCYADMLQGKPVAHDDAVKVAILIGEANQLYRQELNTRDDEIITILLGFKPLTDLFGISMGDDTDREELTDADMREIEKLKVKMRANKNLCDKIQQKVILLNEKYPRYVTKYFVKENEVEREVKKEEFDVIASEAKQSPDEIIKRTERVAIPFTFEEILDEEAEIEYRSDDGWDALLDLGARIISNPRKVWKEVKKLADLSLYIPIFQRRYGKRLEAEAEKQFNQLT